jgi:8-oxo-dGTP pyrophosphatase MutT (NUDIX family)
VERPTTPPDGAASAERRATDDPRVFLVPDDALPDGFARRVAGGGFTPAPPRPAATIVLARDAAEGPEVLLLRRHRASGFAAGAWVFPGGVVDEGDAGAADMVTGPPADAWAARLGTADAVAFVAAAIREAFEETGILLHTPGPASHAPADEALVVARRALLSGVVGIREVAVSLGVRFDASSLVYLAHWVTPEPEPRRYDTRFFLARVPEGAVCTPHRGELVDSRWAGAGTAVAEFEAGRLPLLPPTVLTLRALAAFASVDAMLASLADAPVPEILPVMRAVGAGVEIVLPDLP